MSSSSDRQKSGFRQPEVWSVFQETIVANYIIMQFSIGRTLSRNASLQPEACLSKQVLLTKMNECMNETCPRLLTHLQRGTRAEHLVVLTDPLELAVHTGERQATARLAVLLQLLRQAVLHVPVRRVALHRVVAVPMPTVVMAVALRGWGGTEREADREKYRE